MRLRVLDTDFISALMRGTVPHAAIRRLAQLPPEAQCTTAITPGERKYGESRSELERAGTPLSPADLQIAAIALAGHMTVVTGNTKHLGRVPGVKIEDWLHA